MAADTGNVTVLPEENFAPPPEDDYAPPPGDDFSFALPPLGADSTSFIQARSVADTSSTPRTRLSELLAEDRQHIDQIVADRVAVEVATQLAGVMASMADVYRQEVRSMGRELETALTILLAHLVMDGPQLRNLVATEVDNRVETVTERLMSEVRSFQIAGERNTDRVLSRIEAQGEDVRNMVDCATAAAGSPHRSPLSFSELIEFPEEMAEMADVYGSGAGSRTSNSPGTMPTLLSTSPLAPMSATMPSSNMSSILAGPSTGFTSTTSRFGRGMFSRFTGPSSSSTTNTSPSLFSRQTLYTPSHPRAFGLSNEDSLLLDISQGHHTHTHNTLQGVPDIPSPPSPRAPSPTSLSIRPFASGPTQSDDIDMRYNEDTAVEAVRVNTVIEGHRISIPTHSTANITPPVSPVPSSAEAIIPANGGAPAIVVPTMARPSYANTTQGASAPAPDALPASTHPVVPIVEQEVNTTQAISTSEPRKIGEYITL